MADTLLITLAALRELVARRRSPRTSTSGARTAGKCPTPARMFGSAGSRSTERRSPARTATPNL